MKYYSYWGEGNMTEREKQLIIYKNVCGEKKKFYISTNNFFTTNDLKDVTKNQGIARHRLRGFIKSNNIEYDHWKV
jgi:hypothetical protein